MRLNDLIGRADIVMMTLDTLRYDVAADCLAAGRTPHLAALIGPGGWQKRHSPASFTYAAHAAFFAGFLPTPAAPGAHHRLFAARFPGSETTGPDSFVFDEPDLPTALAARGYHTACIGGTGFFNGRTALGSVLPGLFAERIWHEGLGVTAIDSPKAQCAEALAVLDRQPAGRRLFLFVNVSAIHQPNRHYLPGAPADSRDSHAAALAAVDAGFAPLWPALAARGPTAVILCSDHGTAYGEDGYHGHRIGHETVWTVPYAEAVIGGNP